MLRGSAVAGSDRWPMDNEQPAALDPLVGATIELPGGEHALVLSIEGEYDDDTTLRYVTGDYAGSLTQRDTFAVRRYPIVRTGS